MNLSTLVRKQGRIPGLTSTAQEIVGPHRFASGAGDSRRPQEHRSAVRRILHCRVGLDHRLLDPTEARERERSRCPRFGTSADVRAPQYVVQVFERGDGIIQLDQDLPT